VELQRVAAITAQTLRFHKQATNPQELLTEELIKSVLSVFQGRLSNSHVSVLERYRAQQPVRCFEGEIRQVLSNLVSNALDAMIATGGNLFIRTSRATHGFDDEIGIVITVADNGGGMAEATLAKLFLPFFTTKGVTGTGLGLWVSKEIVDRHRGTLRVRSSQALD
jgi:signal transduction histidine kinase